MAKEKSSKGQMEDKVKKVDHVSRRQIKPPVSVLVGGFIWPTAQSLTLKGWLFLHQSLEQAAKIPALPDLEGYYFASMFSGALQHILPASLQWLSSKT